ncbi:MAG: aldo/keto reductase [Prevotellaceae bacterium]|jgi:diketogulonate reductase-like aldo/keto reductase|nr:aldo/keto reductase [Prevotellaceae bacterium]
MIKNEYAKLVNGVEIPMLGFGTWQIEEEKQAVESVAYALQTGYRHIDTAAVYKNEQFVATGIKESGLNRSDIFLTSKLWNSDQGYESALKAFDASLKKLNTDYLDLYLIHWPKNEKSNESWKALEKLYSEGRIKAIGVSNFLQHHLEDLMRYGKINPMVNQMEFHPYLVQPKLLEFCKTHNIQYEAWSPLMQGRVMNIELLQQIAARVKRSVAQVVLRWDIQMGVVTIPKSITPGRIKENAQVFDFTLSDDDVEAIAALDKDQRVGPHPDKINF